MKYLSIIVLGSVQAFAQEAQSGVEVSATISGEAVQSHTLSESPRGGFDMAAGFRAVLYPTWKIDDHWSVTGSFQLYSAPYFYDQFSTQGYGLYGNIQQASLNYSSFFDGGSVTIRAGELSSAFGSFLLRYDDAVNPLIDIPLSYGYYYEGVSILPVAGAQADVTFGKLDARVQFANS